MFRWLRLGFELRTPIPESLERDSLRLAILPLVQVATLPRLMMRPSEVRFLTRPRPMLVHHIVISIFKTEDENRSGALAAEHLCEKWTLTAIRCSFAPLPCSVETIPCSAEKIPCSLA